MVHASTAVSQDTSLHCVRMVRHYCQICMSTYRLYFPDKFLGLYKKKKKNRIKINAVWKEASPLNTGINFLYDFWAEKSKNEFRTKRAMLTRAGSSYNQYTIILSGFCVFQPCAQRSINMLVEWNLFENLFFWGNWSYLEGIRHGLFSTTNRFLSKGKIRLFCYVVSPKNLKKKMDLLLPFDIKDKILPANVL